MPRESGFYWVQIYGELLPARWVIARYESKYDEWYFTGNGSSYSPDSITEVNEARILPPQN